MLGNVSLQQAALATCAPAASKRSASCCCACRPIAAIPSYAGMQKASLSLLRPAQPAALLEANNSNADSLSILPRFRGSQCTSAAHRQGTVMHQSWAAWLLQGAACVPGGLQMGRCSERCLVSGCSCSRSQRAVPATSSRSELQGCATNFTHQGVLSSKFPGFGHHIRHFSKSTRPSCCKTARWQQHYSRRYSPACYLRGLILQSAIDRSNIGSLHISAKESEAEALA